MKAETVMRAATANTATVIFQILFLETPVDKCSTSMPAASVSLSMGSMHTAAGEAIVQSGTLWACHQKNSSPSGIPLRGQCWSLKLLSLARNYLWCEYKFWDCYTTTSIIPSLIEDAKYALRTMTVKGLGIIWVEGQSTFTRSFEDSLYVIIDDSRLNV